MNKNSKVVENVIFKVILSSSLLKRILVPFSDLIQEFNVEFDSTGINIQFMDTSQVALISLFLDSKEMSFFEVKRTISLGMSLASLNKIISFGSTSTNQISLTQIADQDSIKIGFESEEKTSTFFMKLMDIDSMKTSVPPMEYSYTITMKSMEFTNLINKLETIGDSVTIYMSEKSMILKVKGDIGSVEIVFNSQTESEVYDREDDDDDDDDNFTKKDLEFIDDGEDNGYPLDLIKTKKKPIASKLIKKDSKYVDIKCKLGAKPLIMSFALKYLRMFGKTTKLSETVLLHMSPDSPLYLEYNIKDNEINDGNVLGHLKFYLAPKINDEEDEMV